MQSPALNYTGQRVLVTGGAGFLGRHLTRSLLDDGAEVLVIDNFLTAAPEDMPEHRRLTVIRHDVTQRCPVDGPISHLFNLACPASPAQYQRDPIATWRTSVYGADLMAELASEKGARFIQASTSEVYGDPLESPQSEHYRGNTSSVGPRACYDEGKRAAESLLMDVHRVHGTDVRIARIFNTYGPGMALNDGRVVSNFVVQALLVDSLSVYGDGSQTRSFCYVSDMVSGLRALGQAPDIAGEVVNLGNPTERTVAELATAVATVLGRELQITRRPMPADDPRRRCPDITKARRLLDWAPKVDLAEGLAATVKEFRGRV